MQRGFLENGAAWWIFLKELLKNTEYTSNYRTGFVEMRIPPKASAWFSVAPIWI